MLCRTRHRAAIWRERALDLEMAAPSAMTNLAFERRFNKYCIAEPLTGEGEVLQAMPYTQASGPEEEPVPRAPYKFDPQQ